MILLRAGLVVSVWRLPGYRELRELGAGAQGRVVLARGDGGAIVAIKYLSGGSAEDRRVFRHEAEILSRVDNPHVARIYSLVEADDGAAILMEAVDGVSLRQVLDKYGSLEPEAALVVLKGAVLGLSAAHSVGVVHRDFKPANVIVKTNGESKLIDFGIAVLAGEGGRSGTPAYMSPEQWKGEPASAATDLYAATCVFFECLTGRRPFTGMDSESLRIQHTTELPLLEDIPESLRALVARGMAKEQGERLCDAQAFISDLEDRAVAGYGKNWENHGLELLAASTAVFASLLPIAALAAEKTGLLSKLATWKAGGVAATSTATAVALTILFWPAGSSLEPAWNLQGLKPAGVIKAIDGGFVFAVRDDEGDYELIAVDGNDGGIRWRHAVDPLWGSLDGLAVGTLAAKGSMVVYPTRLSDPLMSEVTAVDSVTGKPRWTYGAGGVELTNAPEFCGVGQQICIGEYVGGTVWTRVLDPKDGRVVRSAKRSAGRLMSRGEELGGLYSSQDRSDLVRINSAGKLLWQNSVAKYFGTVPTNRFWGLRADYARSVGVIGYSDSGNWIRHYGEGTSKLAGFDLQTGQALWLDRGSDMKCGVLKFDIEHPVRCRLKGTGKGREISGFDATLEGFDLSTGRTTWTWHAGDARFLDGELKDILQLSDTRYFARTRQGDFLIDLDRGVKPVYGVAPTGWCKDFINIKPRGKDVVRRHGGLREASVFAPYFWPCTIDRTETGLPQSVPDYVGARSGKVFAWIDETSVQAVRGSEVSQPRTS